MTDVKSPSAICEAALAYANSYEVVALPYPPYVAGWPLSAADATREPATLVRWWREWPEARVGVVVPPETLVLEIAATARDCAVSHAGATMHSLDDAGTRRLWFTARASDAPPGVTDLAPGVAVRGPDAVVLVPPAPDHRWIDARFVAPLPGTLGTLLRDVPHDRVTRRVVTSGEQDAYLAQYVQALLDDGVQDRERLIEIAVSHNEAVCRPPHSWWDVAQIVDSTRASM